MRPFLLFAIRYNRLMRSKWSPLWVASLVIIVIFAIGAFFGVRALLGSAFQGMDTLARKQTGDARKELAAAANDSDKCFALAQIAKDDFNRGKFAEASQYANQLLSISKRLTPADGGPFGIAVHDSNMVLGRLALKYGKKEAAKQFLLSAGLTTGAPTLDSFGPNMSLANDLLAAGESATVIEYFHECRKFWSFKKDTLLEWESDVKAGNTPNFGANLVY